MADLNDFAHDHEAIREAGEGAETIEECPVKALGERDGVYYFATPTGKVRAFKPRDFSPVGLIILFNNNETWLRQNAPQTKDGVVTGFVTRRAAGILAAMCEAAGIFDVDEDVRGPGAWRDASGELILHCGDRLLVRGKWHKAGQTIDGKFYVVARPEPRPGDTPAEAGLVGELYEFLESWSWLGRSDARLLLGWLACGYLVGTLRWRPHVWVTGSPGTGKTTLQELLHGLLGEVARHTADPTAAGIWQMLGGSARPIFIDEIGRARTTSRADELVRLARLASSDAQGEIVRGSADGTVKRYKVRASLYFTSINHAELMPEDLGRIAILRLGRRRHVPAEARSARAILERLVDQAPALRARAIMRAADFDAVLEVYETALAELGQDARFADQLGTLLAGADCLLLDDVPTIEHAREVVAGLELGERGETPENDDSAQCLNALLTYPISAMIHTGSARERRDMTIAELVGAVVGLMPRGQQAALGPWGLRLDDLAGIPYLVVANVHAGLSRIFQDTTWGGREWKQALERLDGATRGPVISFGGSKSRGVWIPLALLSGVEEIARQFSEARTT